MIYIYFTSMIVSFAVLFKSASFFVGGASSIAKILNIPKMIIGIVLVGLATTAPEFCVSVWAAFLGHPEIALGNAVGSVICDDGIALALAAILTPAVILVNCRILKAVGIFLVSIDVLAYYLARNGIFGRIEGFLLIIILCIYYIFILKNRNYIFDKNSQNNNESSGGNKDKFPHLVKAQLKQPALLFLAGLSGVIVTSYIIVWAAKNIALYFSISETAIGLTIIAIGTSLPEISTCITAALRREGEIAVGNILGADILNILWIIGVASIVRPIKVELNVINFSFPYMILIVITMLVSMRIGCRLGKMKGFILLGLYILYLFLTICLFGGVN